MAETPAKKKYEIHIWCNPEKCVYKESQPGDDYPSGTWAETDLGAVSTLDKFFFYEDFGFEVSAAIRYPDTDSFFFDDAEVTIYSQNPVTGERRFYTPRYYQNAIVEECTYYQAYRFGLVFCTITAPKARMLRITTFQISGEGNFDLGTLVLPGEYLPACWIWRGSLEIKNYNPKNTDPAKWGFPDRYYFGTLTLHEWGYHELPETPWIRYIKQRLPERTWLPSIEAKDSDDIILSKELIPFPRASGISWAMREGVLGEVRLWAYKYIEGFTGYW